MDESENQAFSDWLENADETELLQFMLTTEIAEPCPENWTRVNPRFTFTIDKAAIKSVQTKLFMIWKLDGHDSAICEARDSQTGGL